MKKNVFQIGLYLNTTRVNLDKVPGVFEYLAEEGVAKSVDFCRKNKIPHLVPYDTYMELWNNFKRYDKREDKRTMPMLILFLNGEVYSYLGCREKIWYQHCPDCKTPTRKLPFKKFDKLNEEGKEVFKFDDIFECPECGKMFHISLSGGKSYV